MRRLLIIPLTCLSFAVMAQIGWKTYSPYGTVYNNWSQYDQLRHECGYYPEGRNPYPPDLSIKESKKTRKKKRKARKRGYPLPVTNMEVLTDRKKLAITVAIDAENKEAFHLKLINAEGRVVQSYLHLSPKSVKEFEMHRHQPGNYKLNVYAGIERRLLSSFTVKRY